MNDLSAVSTRELAARQILAKVLTEQVKELGDEVRAAFAPSLRPGESVAAVMPDGTEVGHVKLTKPSTSAAVTDSAALLAWVKEHRPDEVVTTEAVRSAFVDALKVQAKKHGHAFDTETGEVIPGIDVITGSSSYRPEPSDEGRAYIEARVANIRRGVLPPAETDKEESA